MGRPLKKSFFGSPTTGGKQLVLSHVWLEGSTVAEEGYYIIRQVGTGRYQVTNGVKVGVVKLVDAMPDAPGEGTIEITVFGSTTREYAKKIHNRTVVTFDGNTYKWSTSAASEAGQADLPFEDFVTVDEEEEAIAEVNGAADGAAVVALLLATPEVYLTSDSKEIFDTLTPSSRQLAVGDGVAEWATLFGEYASLAVLRDAVDLHTTTEGNKMAFIVGVDETTTVKALEKAIKNLLPAVVADRKRMIVDLKTSGVTAAIARGEELEVEDFTVVLSALEARSKESDFTAVVELILEGRNALSNSKFFGTDRMLPVISAALAA
ncbi:hypothetical protein D3C87_482460 [compost metagenome]